MKNKTKLYKVTYVNGYAVEVEANDKTSAMLRAMGKALEAGHKDAILSGKGMHGTGVKSCKLLC